MSISNASSCPDMSLSSATDHTKSLSSPSSMERSSGPRWQDTRSFISPTGVASLLSSIGLYSHCLSEYLPVPACSCVGLELLKQAGVFAASLQSSIFINKSWRAASLVASCCLGCSDICVRPLIVYTKQLNCFISVMWSSIKGRRTNFTYGESDTSVRIWVWGFAKSCGCFNRVDKFAEVLLCWVFICSSVGLQTFCVSKSASLISVQMLVRSIIGMAAKSGLKGIFSSGWIDSEAVMSLQCYKREEKAGKKIVLINGNTLLSSKQRLGNITRQHEHICSYFCTFI